MQVQEEVQVQVLVSAARCEWCQSSPVQDRYSVRQEQAHTEQMQAQAQSQARGRTEQAGRMRVGEVGEVGEWMDEWAKWVGGSFPVIVVRIRTGGV